MSSSLESLSPDDLKKLESYLQMSKNQFQEMADIRESHRDYTKHLAEELGVKPKFLMRAAKIAWKNNQADHKEEMDTVDEILEITGNQG